MTLNEFRRVSSKSAQFFITSNADAVKTLHNINLFVSEREREREIERERGEREIERARERASERANVQSVSTTAQAVR